MLRQERKSESLIGLGWEGSGCPVVVRGTTAEYRRCLAAVATPEDIAVEIGSAAGVTTIQLARQCARAIGVDASQGEVDGAVANATQKGLLLTTQLSEAVAAADEMQSDFTKTQPVVQFVVAKVARDGGENRVKASLDPLAAALAERFDHGLRDVTLLAIDIAGTAPIESVTPLIVSLRSVMRPRITVVKSLSLRKLLVALNAGEAMVADVG